ncbi:unnamed protein product [Aspergillus oryzae RIB40]|uniref:DNA, SC023 n=1 Tax=Aspergillus oryzae (strain ATCC 42149 / RIB 40) TaxID=510516 RepID=Q2UH57_ASPOR|nr:unnamed protein product [Aspergillus oryzae RIB40]BAE59108.1 unnamed protein product [Aspergillus oryzae RIB40]
MATHVLTATTTPANPISVYGNPSPVNTASNSPTSPRQQYLPLQTRQLRPPKGPLYVPAALRPTERPQKASPPSPPRSVHGSLDSLNDGSEEPQPALTRRSTIESAVSDGISKLAQDEWMKHEHLGEVTGLPTREHWKNILAFASASRLDLAFRLLARSSDLVFTLRLMAFFFRRSARCHSIVIETGGCSF